MNANDVTMQDTDIQDSKPEGTSKLPAPFSVNILQLLKSSQTQYGGHGGTYGDYTRYRRYCNSRLRRLYKALKFLHGRGKYIKKTIEPSNITDPRFLHIPLYSAERAWAYFMELKQAENKLLQSANKKSNARLHSHLIGRLTRACKWADSLSRLSSEKADSRTALEAEAYASYMWGTLYVEKENDWHAALDKFLRARAVYDQLAKVGDLTNQVLCRQRVEELDTNVRFCNYKLGRTDISQTKLSEFSADGNAALELLQSKLQAVMEEERSHQAASMMELPWLGHVLAVHNSKTRLCLLRGKEIEKELANLSAQQATDRKLSLFDKIFVVYQDAKRNIREDMEKVGSAEEMKIQLNMLDKAISCILLQKFMDRNSVLVAAAKLRLERQQRGLKEEKGEKHARPEELVRLYDLLIQNTSELVDLVTASKELNQDEIAFAALITAKRSTFLAFRCFYVAQSFSNSSKLKEAYVLYNSAENKCLQAINSYKNINNPPIGDIEEMNELEKKCKAQRCLIHVNLTFEDSKAKQDLQKTVAKLSISDVSPPFDKPEQKLLMDCMDEYRAAISFAPSGSKVTSFITELPPNLMVMPCRPIVLDTALDALEFPSLEDRVKKETKKPSGIFNFWRR